MSIEPYCKSDDVVLFNADCLKVMRQFKNDSFDLIVTDVPYNTGMNQKSSKNSKWLKNFFNDSYTEDGYQKLVDESSKEMFRVLKEDKNLYLFINWKEYPRWFFSLKKVGFNIKACIVWDKVIHGLGSQYKYTHEFIIFASKGKGSIKKPSELSKYYKDIWRIQRMNFKDKKHATQKPLRLIELPVKHSTCENDIVLDPFMGSGTTLVAAKKLGRKVVGIELNKEYCDIAVKRIKEYEGIKRLDEFIK